MPRGSPTTKVTVRFTESQLAQMNSQRGDIPLANYVRYKALAEDRPPESRPVIREKPKKRQCPEHPDAGLTGGRFCAAPGCPRVL